MKTIVLKYINHALCFLVAHAVTVHGKAYMAQLASEKRDIQRAKDSAAKAHNKELVKLDNIKQARHKVTTQYDQQIADQRSKVDHAFWKYQRAGLK